MEGLRRIWVKTKTEKRGPNSEKEHGVSLSHLTVKHNEHFHHFLALLLFLSGSVGVLLFACYSGSTGILTHAPPHYRQKGITGGYYDWQTGFVMCKVCVKADFNLTAAGFVMWVRVVGQKCCYGRKGFHNKKKNIVDESLKGGACDSGGR